MKTITIGFSKPKTFHTFSALIMWWQGTPFSHTYIKFSTQYGDLIYHAAKTMVHFISAENFYVNNEDVYTVQLQLEDAQFNKIVQFAIDNAGKPYSLMQIGAILVRDIARKLRLPFCQENINGTGSFICSELVADMLYDKLDNPDYVTPLDLFNALVKINEGQK